MAEIKESKILVLFSRPFLIIPLLLLLISISYANTLYSPFVLDDMHSFLEEPNVYVKDFSYESFGKLSNTIFGKARLIPLATFALNHQFAKGQMPPFHITNILIHLLATLVLFWLLKVILRTPVGSSALKGIPINHFCFIVTALWALNPVQTNVVTYIVQRMTSISALFYLASIASYVSGRLANTMGRTLIYYLCSATMALGAFFSKENSFMLPFAILLVEWMFITPDLFHRVFQKLKWFHWVVIILLIALILPLGEHRWEGFLQSYNNIRPFTLAERLLTESRVVVHYLFLLFLPLPARMNFDYDFMASTSLFAPPTTVLAILLLLFMIIGAFRYRVRYPLISFGVFWYFLNLLIESTIIPLELVFEHRLYVPSFGFYLAFLAGLDLAVSYMKKKHSSREVELLFVLGMVLVICSFSIFTTVRNNVWRDSYALYSDCVKKSPNKPRVYLNQGVAMGRDRNLERESIEVFEKVIALGSPKKERYIQAVNNIVVAHVTLEEYKEAIIQGKKYLDEAPSYISGQGYPRLMNNLAYCYYKTGEYSEAMRLLSSGLIKEKRKLNGYIVNMMVTTLSEAYNHENFREELQLTDEDGNKLMSVRLRMAKLPYDLKDHEKANDFLAPVVEKYPDHELANKLNESIQNDREKNRRQEESFDLNSHPPYKANTTYRMALDLADFIQKYYSPLIGTVGWLLDKAEEATQPDDPFIIWYRVKWFMKKADRNNLIRGVEKGVELQPDFVPLLRLGGDYYYLIGEHEKAVEIFSHILELYPAEPQWLRYQKKILQFAENEEV